MELYLNRDRLGNGKRMGALRHMRDIEMSSIHCPRLPTSGEFGEAVELPQPIEDRL